MTEEKTTAFKRWYDKHKDEFAKKRKERYENDPAYRQKILDAAKAYRDNRVQPIARDPTHVFSLPKAAAEIGVLHGVIRRWREAGYFPEPYEHAGRAYFTVNQVELLKKIHGFFSEHGVRTRMTVADKKKLDDVVSFIYSNW